MNEKEYAGFWIRTGAALIDTLILVIITLPILMLIYGEDYWVGESFVQGFWDLLLNHIFPAVAVVLFWVYKSATPGKMATKLTIVDASTGEKPTTRQFILRYIGYFASILPLCLGLIWVGIDKRKQGFHDKIANTVVIRSHLKEPVRFQG